MSGKDLNLSDKDPYHMHGKLNLKVDTFLLNFGHEIQTLGRRITVLESHFTLRDIHLIPF